MFIVEDEAKANCSLKIKFGSPASIQIYISRPVSIIQGLAKIGGFLGFLKIFSVFLSFAHELMFERSLR